MDRLLQEVHLILCSLLDDEMMLFEDENDEGWEALLHAYAETGLVEDTTLTPRTPCRFIVRLDASDTCILVRLPLEYPNARPTVSVRGNRLIKAAQERWNEVIQSGMTEVYANPTELPVYDLISTHLLPLLHQEADEEKERNLATTQNKTNRTQNKRYHALFTSHHLISPTKRRNMQRWTSELSLVGFAKVGYPGVIYCEGDKENVEDFVAKVKAMQWLALRVRFVEELDEEYKEEDGKRGGQWVELEKVGEVVQYMRDIGRDRYVLEVGIGAGANT